MDLWKRNHRLYLKKEIHSMNKEKTTAKKGGKTLSITYLGLILLFVVFSLIYLFTLFRCL